MTQHLSFSVRHAACRMGRGSGLLPWVHDVCRRLVLLGILLLAAAPALADGMPSEREDGGDALRNALAADPFDMQLLTPSTPPLPPPPPHWAFTEMPPWEDLEEGLQLGLFPARFNGGGSFEMVILRIDPARYDFTVETASAEGRALSLGDWATRKDLVAAINASMYLPDGVTSTGYLRSGETVNNGRIVSRFGAFFVAGADDESLPGANLLDRSTDDWENLLTHYRMVVQNYRMISSERHLLWKPGGPRHSISAVGRDGTGAILFILCREPLTGVDFGTLLLALPIDVRLVMYTEGGSQAGLLVRTQARRDVWMGRYWADFWVSGSQGAPLPNVIGVRRRP
ncbi:phosphodiester glycosidase family protein [uncultured Bilophila sp.]|uniref:phosphodiester glycosidase family protein n=1 Tax=uncultured Bilophila sp. TaxID=529385 RepID=UPI0025F66FAE|nr:phosphodiester glycosidase family protein [uncultured Bilophila sp.]